MFGGWSHSHMLNEFLVNTQLIDKNSCKWLAKECL